MKQTFRDSTEHMKQTLRDATDTHEADT